VCVGRMRLSGSARSHCPKGSKWAMRLGSSLDRTSKMAEIIPLPQTSKWAKCSNQPPTRQRNQATRTREYLTGDEVERMIVAARRASGRLADLDALLILIASLAQRADIGADRISGGTEKNLKTRMLHLARVKTAPPRNIRQSPKLTRSLSRKHKQCDTRPK
jgi:hypothetical protein